MTNDSRRFSGGWLVVAAVAAALITLGLAALLTNIFQKQQEARNPFYRVVTLTDTTVDPKVWGQNFPQQYDDYLKTVDQVRTRYGGSEACRASRRLPIHARTSRSRAWTRIRGWWSSGRATHSRRIFAKNAATHTCWTTRCSPSDNK